MKISVLVSLSAIFMIASSTLYSVSSDYQVTNQVSVNELAHATYEANSYEKGWNYLHIYANSQVGLL